MDVWIAQIYFWAFLFKKKILPREILLYLYFSHYRKESKSLWTSGKMPAPKYRQDIKNMRQQVLE